MSDAKNRGTRGANRMEGTESDKLALLFRMWREVGVLREREWVAC